MVKFWKYTGFPVLCGIVFGMMLATFTKDIGALSWLSYGLVFGMENPLILNLGIIDLTFGLAINLNVATIICITLCLIVAKYIFKR